MENTLVVGASGQLGMAVVRKLLGAGKSVRALVRDSIAAARVAQAGAEPCFGDLTQPQTLPPAYRGVTAVVATANAAVMKRQAIFSA